jgi:hypothetical protein
MKIRHIAIAALSAVALSLAPLAPAMAADPARWGQFGLGAVFAHTFLGLAAWPLAVAGVIAAQSQQDRGYAAQPSYAPPAGYAPPAYGPPAYYAAAPAYYPPAPQVYYSPRAAYYAPAPRYYAPPVSYYGRPGGYSYYGRPSGYYGARPGYYAVSGYQAARRSGYYHYSR